MVFSISLYNFCLCLFLYYGVFLNLLNCAPTRPRAYLPYPSFIRTLRTCAPWHLSALPIINMRLTSLCAYAPLPSSISASLAFVLSCLVLLQVESKVPMFWVCAPINHSPSVTLVSFILTYKAVLHAFFHSFILSHCLHCYLYNYFATTFLDFLSVFPLK